MNSNQELSLVFSWDMPLEKKAYKVMDLDSYKFFESRDVIFHENTFPFAKPHTAELQRSSGLFPNPPHLFEDNIPYNDDSRIIIEPQTQLYEADRNSPTNSTPEQPRRSSRPHKLPSHLQDYVCCSSSSLYDSSS